MGTLGYMSPEQVRGQPADRARDIFSFGAILYEMLTGKRLRRGITPPSILSAILRSTHLRPSLRLHYSPFSLTPLTL
jgi:serine/threonine protein kinase